MGVYNKLQKAERLIEQGADVNYRDTLNQILLHRTVDSDVVELFIKAGVDIDALESKGDLPLLCLVKVSLLFSCYRFNSYAY